MKIKIIIILLMFYNFAGAQSGLLVGSKEGPQGVKGATGDQGIQGIQGPQGQSGVNGQDGVNCWDLDGDGVNDLAEDINGDGLFNTLDCQGNANDSQVSIVAGTGLTGGGIFTLNKNSNTVLTLNSSVVDTKLSQLEVNSFESDPTVLASVKDGVSWGEVTGKPVIPTNNNQLSNGAGYLTSELDPTVLASVKDGVSWEEITGVYDLLPNSGNVTGFIDVDGGTFTLTAPTGGGSSSSIYTANGTANGRTVTVGSSDLTFFGANNTSDVLFNSVRVRGINLNESFFSTSPSISSFSNSSPANIDYMGYRNSYGAFVHRQSLVLGSPNKLYLKTPNVWSGTATTGQVPTLQADGSIEFTTLSGGGGGAPDGNNYPTSVSVTGTNTKTLTINRNGLSPISTSWTDLQGGGGSSDGNGAYTGSGTVPNNTFTQPIGFWRLGNGSHYIDFEPSNLIEIHSDSDIRIKPNGSGGTNGQFLQTDGNGNVSWANAAGGSVDGVVTSITPTNNTLTVARSNGLTNFTVPLDESSKFSGAEYINSATIANNTYTSSTPVYILTQADNFSLSDPRDGRMFVVSIVDNTGNAQVNTTTGNVKVGAINYASGTYNQPEGTTRAYIYNSSSNLWISIPF